MSGQVRSDLEMSANMSSHVRTGLDRRVWSCKEWPEKVWSCQEWPGWTLPPRNDMHVVYYTVFQIFVLFYFCYCLCLCMRSSWMQKFPDIRESISVDSNIDL